MIGDAAKNQLTTNPENTVFDAKRMIGREWTDKAVQHDIKYFPFKVVEKNTKPHIVLETQEGEKVFAAEEISAMVLLKMKETAEAYLGKKVTHAVVTVPAVSFHTHTDTDHSIMLTYSPLLILQVNLPILRKFREIRNLFTFYNMTSISFTKKTSYSEQFSPRKMEIPYQRHILIGEVCHQHEYFTIWQNIDQKLTLN